MGQGQSSQRQHQRRWLRSRSFWITVLRTHHPSENFEYQRLRTFACKPGVALFSSHLVAIHSLRTVFFATAGQLTNKIVSGITNA